MLSWWALWGSDGKDVNIAIRRDTLGASASLMSTGAQTHLEKLPGLRNPSKRKFFIVAVER